MRAMAIPQKYPRIDEPHKFASFLDEAHLKPHERTIPADEMRRIISESIEYANERSSRDILGLSSTDKSVDASALYLTEGAELFKYFRQYCGDPASTAVECCGRHFSKVAEEQFRNRMLQKGRMNSGWRYQRIAYQTAGASGRFKSVSDLGVQEADFNLTIETRNYPGTRYVNAFVSVKNRANTIGGPDWPKAVEALETMARKDKNKQGPYICIFAFAMERGNRRKSKSPRIDSVNTELWHSEYFWPFVSNSPYESIMQSVSDFLAGAGIETENRTMNVVLPTELVDSFGECCREHDLVDASGNFRDRRKLVSFFCSKPSKRRTKRKREK